MSTEFSFPFADKDISSAPKSDECRIFDSDKIFRSAYGYGTHLNGYGPRPRSQ